jgi:CheY-like chemotaxis protein
MTTQVQPPPSLRLLVVDDNEDSADCVSLLFEMSGHQTRTAHDGKGALHTARQFAPHIVFLDIGLPDMTGYEVARTFRADPRLASAKLIALTGFSSAEDKQKALDAGFDFHLTKPVELEVVRALLPNLFGS